METKYENYDMLDKLIANNKKAQSWTIFWVITLCLLAGAVLWMALTISAKNRTISEQRISIQTQTEYLEAKSQLIDSLVANCNVAKKEIAKTYDSAIARTETALQTIVNTSAAAGMPEQLKELQQNEIKKVSKEIQYVKNNIENIQVNIRKPATRLFIEYNDKDNSEGVEQLMKALKVNSNYYVAPSEFINNTFPTIIKFYNHQDDGEANRLRDMVAKQFNISAGSITIQNETNPKIKSTIEIWIGTKKRVDVKQIMIKKQ